MKNNFSPTNIEIPDSVDTNSRVIKILKLSGFTPPPIKPSEQFSQIYLTYNLTLYHSDRKKFIGRTYQSVTKRLNNKNNEVMAKEYIFFHTTNQIERELQCVVEAYITMVPKIGAEYTYHSVGYCSFSLSMASDKGQKIPVIKGSPRELLLKKSFTSGVESQKNGMFEIQIVDAKSINDLKLLIPANTLAGKGDTVPGIQGGKMLFAKSDLHYSPTQKVTVYPVEIEMSPGLDSIFQRSMNVRSADDEGRKSAF